MNYRIVLLVLSFALVGAGCLAASRSVRAQADATPAPEVETPGVTGTSYTSPTWGYSLEWPDHWEVIASFTDQGADGVTHGLTSGDYLLLSYGLPNGNSVSLELMAGVGYDGSPETCLDTYVEDHLALQEQESKDVSVEGFRLAESGGQVIGGHDDSSAYGIFEYDMIGEEFHWHLVDYVDCRTLADEGAILRIEASVLRENYPAAVPLIQEVLATLTMADADLRNVTPLRALPPLDPLPEPSASPSAGTDAEADNEAGGEVVEPLATPNTEQLAPAVTMESAT